MEDNQKKVSVYDPIVDAYREVSIECAEKIIENHEKIKSDIATAKEDQSE